MKNKNAALAELLESLQDDNVENDVVEEPVKKSKPEVKELNSKYVIENVTDYKSFCEVTGLEYLDLDDFSDTINPDKSLAQEQLNQIEWFFGKGWKKDWSDKSQKKYYPYFTIDDKGGLVFDDVYGCYHFTDGAVAYFKDSKIAAFVGKTFVDLYQKLL